MNAQEPWLRALLCSTSDAIFSTDADGLINYMNPVAEQLMGCTAEDARGRSPDEVLVLVDEHSRSVVPRPSPEDLNKGRTLCFDAVLPANPVAERFIFNSTSPILGDDGSVLGAVTVLRDVTAGRELQRQVEVCGRLATVGTMAAGVAHEVNNPLTYILANIGWSRATIRKRQSEVAGNQDLGWLDPVEGALADAEVGASRIAKIVADMSSFTRPGPETNEPVNLGDVIDWSLAVARHELQPRTFVVRQFGATPLVAAPSARLGQVFVNLLINAAHALDMEQREANEIVVTTRTNQQGAAVVEIRDNGCGMSPEVMERIFEPFFTTKAVGHGTGLGLSVCQGIAESLGGTIVFESEPGKGTVVRVTLPAGPSQPVALAPIEPDVMACPHSYLMVVDDEPMVGASIQRLLDREHTVVCPTSPRKALALVTGGMRFDLILSDLMLPARSGIDLYRRILACDPEQARRMVFLNGGAFTPPAAAFLRSVPNRSISKPYVPHELRRMLSELLVEMGPIVTHTATVFTRSPELQH